MRILELGQVISVPYAGLLLADLGAEVIKIEAPGGGDSARNPEITGLGDLSATFITFNRNKRSLMLDLKDPADYARFTRLVESSDVVVSNMIPRVLKNLGADYAALTAINPRIVVCAIQGFTSGDPRVNEPSYDLTHQALSGIMLMEGSPGDPPMRVCIPIADLGAAQFAVNGILAALIARGRTGLGDYVEVPMYDVMLSMLTYTGTLYLNSGREPGRMGSEHEYSVPWQAVTASDGQLVIAVRSEKFWRRLCDALGRESWAVDPRFATNLDRLRNRDELRTALNEAFREKDVEYWIDHLSQLGVPTAPVRTVKQALDEEVEQGSQLVQHFDQEGFGPMAIIGNPLKFERSATVLPRSAPPLDEFDDEALLSRAEL